MEWNYRNYLDYFELPIPHVSTHKQKWIHLENLSIVTKV